jgi:hypothetical protein
MTNPINSAPFLRTTREFPDDLDQTIVELNRAYVDIAAAVNNRTIGLFPVSKPAITGNSWFTYKNQNKPSLRQVYNVTGTGTIEHLINIKNVFGFVAIYGTFTDGTLWYPLPYVDPTNAANQISLSVSSTQILITPGAGPPPTVSSGFVILEWISNT